MKAGFFLRACAIFLPALAILILVPATICAATVVNPSFEADGNIFLDSKNATGWSDNIGVYDFDGEISDAYWSSDDTHGALLLAYSSGVFFNGDNAYLRQSVDLTGINAIMFDANLSVHPDGEWMSFLEADFYVDSMKKWSSQTPGTYLDQSVDVTGLTGTHDIEFRLDAIADGSGTGHANWYECDNVRLVPVPEPSSLAIFATGGVGLLAYILRRRRTA